MSRYGAKLSLVIGPLIAAVGFVLFAIPGIGGSYWTTFFPAAMVLGVGMAISVAPLTTTVMGAVGTQRAGIASGINNAVSRAAGLLAIAVMGIIVLSVFNSSLDGHLTVLHLPATIQHMIDVQRTRLVGIEIPTGVSNPVRTGLERAIAESFVASFRVVMLISAVLAAASALSALLLIGGKKKAVTQKELYMST